MELPLDVHVQRNQLNVVVRVVAVPCSCMVVRHVNPSRAFRPCAPDAAPLRYPTHTGKKRHAFRLLGPRGATGVGERRWLPNGVGKPWPPPPSLL